jgi:hypothetical protein
MKKTFTLIGILIVLVLALVAVSMFQKKNSSSQPVSNEIDSAIRARVTEFGTKLQNVSLLMSTSDLKAQMQSEYGPYLTSALLAKWQADPESALGRKTSSPWPDRIEVATVTMLGPGMYKVEGNVIEAANSSTGKKAVSVFPVNLTVEDQNGVWLIANVTQGAYSELPQRIKISGLFECLPHKNTSGPQTAECALGVAVDESDAHYALNLSELANPALNFPTGSHVEVEGMLTPANQLNSDAWQKYPIDGIISVTSIKQI